jgi:hypothetical protein
MKLDRHINQDGVGKYALIKMRKLAEYRGTVHAPAIKDAVNFLVERGILDWGVAGTESEFMVIRLKDAYAAEALEAYAHEAGRFDPEYASEIREMADRAGPNSPWCKKPD